jgi:lysyl-tRNA synthetase class 1
VVCLHWVKKLAETANRTFPEEEIVISAGWSVSGPIHVGNLRADGILPSAIKKELEKTRDDIRQIIIIYDQGGFKAKKEQLIWFDDLGYAEKHKGAPENYTPSQELLEYKGKRLRDVPDPYGCHDSWSEHWMDDVARVLPEYGIHAELIPTSQFYRERAFEIFKEFHEKRELTREIVNKYRGRNKYGEDWIPINPWCPKCKSITDTEPLEIKEDKILMRCNRCGYKGFTEFSESKMNWRLEWAALWKAYGVKIEGFGKDHAMAGGSRESCQELSEKVLDYKAPLGFWTEWVGFSFGEKDMGDMTSSGNMCIPASEFINFFEPWILRYIYLEHRKNMRIVFDLWNIRKYYDGFDRVEEKYFKGELEEPVAYSYEMAVEHVPEERPKRVPFSIAAIVVQIAKEEEWLERIKRFGEFDSELSKERMKRVHYWVTHYAPERAKISLSKEKPEVSQEFKEVIPKAIDTIKHANNAEELERLLYQLAKESIGAKEFFKNMYRVLLNRDEGPRLAPFIISIGKEQVVQRLNEVIE